MHIRLPSPSPLSRAVRDGLRQGGCCASRCNFIGGCLGAYLGPDAIPAEWRNKVGAEIWGDWTALTDKLVAARD